MKRAGFILIFLSGCAGVDCCQPPVQQVPLMSSPPVMLRAPVTSYPSDDVESVPIEKAPVVPSRLSPPPPPAPSPSPFKDQSPDPIPKDTVK